MIIKIVLSMFYCVFIMKCTRFLGCQWVGTKLVWVPNWYEEDYRNCACWYSAGPTMFSIRIPIQIWGNQLHVTGPNDILAKNRVGPTFNNYANKQGAPLSLPMQLFSALSLQKTGWGPPSITMQINRGSHILYPYNCSMLYPCKY